MTRTGEREICSVSGRLPDNPGELARMTPYLYQIARMQIRELSIHRGHELCRNARTDS